MPRETTEPTIDEQGFERHPSWGMVGVSRATVMGGGAHLFDSDIEHRNLMVLTIGEARRKREHGRDWLMRESKNFLEIVMSESQWAALVSSSGLGSGVPCTIRHREDDYLIPEAPYEPRLAESVKEVSEAAAKATAAVVEAMAAYKEKKNAANLRALEIAIQHIPSNMKHVANSLTEHTENVVTKAQSDIEAMVINGAKRLGIEPGDLGVTAPQLTTGEED